MNTLSLSKRIGKTVKPICMLSLALASAPAWSEPEQARYEMSVFSDAAYGTKILAGKYKQAIGKISSRTSSRNELQRKTNLCVAYTKSGEIELAESACEEAVVAAKVMKAHRSPSGLSDSSQKTHNRFVAIALSNRGVINAVKGDLESARKDFDAALQLSSALASVRANLERLEVARRDTV